MVSCLWILFFLFVSIFLVNEKQGHTVCLKTEEEVLKVSAETMGNLIMSRSRVSKPLGKWVSIRGSADNSALQMIQWESFTSF